jgi:hypothetical protein
MKRTDTCKNIIFWTAVCGVLFIFLQTYCRYHFHIVEQNQLFQNTWPYVAGLLRQPGGAALALSEFLVQFFLLPCAGAAITAALLTGAGWLACCMAKRAAPGRNLPAACLAVTVTLMFSHFNFNYLAAGSVALLAAEAAFCLALGIKGRTMRYIAHLAVIPLLFWLAGAVFVLYAALAVVDTFAAGKSGERRSPSASFLLCGGIAGEAVLAGLLSVYFALYGEYRFVFLPDAYFHPYLKPGGEIYLSWCSVVILQLLACTLRGKGAAGKKKKRVGYAVQALAVAALCLWGIPAFGDRAAGRMKELDYYSRTEQWDKILERCGGTLSNYLYILYVNQALLQKGELAGRMFTFDQRGPKGLLPEWNKTSSLSILLSDMYFAGGAVALAQEMAFEANVSAIGDGNPRMLKRLVQTNLIYGAYPVAEKYISILENTFCYREWAKAHRRFLYNDAETERDPLLGNKRRSLPPDASVTDRLDIVLENITAANPQDKSAIEYVGCFYLLEKNMEKFGELIGRRFGTPVLPALPVAFQEAVVILSEADPAFGRPGVSEEVAARFAQYKRQVVEANRSGSRHALPSLMRRTYGDTYWYYYMFK